VAGCGPRAAELVANTIMLTTDTVAKTISRRLRLRSTSDPPEQCCCRRAAWVMIRNFVAGLAF
jgi:hypothetical protein